jgi:protein KRI1
LTKFNILDGDFDPSKYDDEMSKLFNEDFYNVEEDVLPVFDKEAGIDTNAPSAADQTIKKLGDKAHTSDSGESVSGDEEGEGDYVENLKQEPSASAADEQGYDEYYDDADAYGEPSGPVVDKEQLKQILKEESKEVKKLVDEYYNLDYEDMVRVFCKTKTRKNLKKKEKGVSLCPTFFSLLLAYPPTTSDRCCLSPFV